MRVDQFANAVSNFNRVTNERVELLFFQNCNKATVEAIYEVRNCARYTLASQLSLGAPNYYYQGFISRLAESSVDGRAAALAIVNSERADMYHTLTLVDNKAVKRIPEKLSQLLQPVLSSHLPTVRQSELSTHYYMGERRCDALVLFSYLSKISGQGQSEFAEFAEFLRSSVIAYYKTGGNLYGRYASKDFDSDKLCGLSLYLPETPQAASRYNSLALYRGVNLVSLYRRMLTS